MKTSDAFWMFLPQGLGELFEMVRFERSEHAYDIWLDEKKELGRRQAQPEYSSERLHRLCCDTGLSVAGQACLSAHAQEQVVEQADQRDIQLQSGAAQRRWHTTHSRVRVFFKRRRSRRRRCRLSTSLRCTVSTASISLIYTAIS